MIPHKQLFTRETHPDVPGDCLRAVVASILDLPLNAVPHFVELYERRAWPHLREWLRERMINMTRLEGHSHTPDYCMYVGTSPRDPDINHAIVGINGEFIHDPHPESGMIDGVDCTYVFTPLLTDWSRYAPLLARSYDPQEA